MKQTENFGLNLLETADLLSPRPLNENAEKVEAALGGMAEKLLGRVMLATGSYTGDGTKTVTIQTPGFTPKTVLMRQARVIGVAANGTVYTHSFSVDGGWVHWTGHESYITNVYAPDAVLPDGSQGVIGRERITFTAKKGSLTWTTRYGDLPGVSKNINNEKDVEYAWIAFGYGEEG